MLKKIGNDFNERLERRRCVINIAADESHKYWKQGFKHLKHQLNKIWKKKIENFHRSVQSGSSQNFIDSERSILHSVMDTKMIF